MISFVLFHYAYAIDFEKILWKELTLERRLEKLFKGYLVSMVTLKRSNIFFPSAFGRSIFDASAKGKKFHPSNKTKEKGVGTLLFPIFTQVVKKEGCSLLFLCSL
jgi:hypothetical protein